MSETGTAGYTYKDLAEQPWSVRIPSAITRAEEYLGGTDSRMSGAFGTTLYLDKILTATEVALAKALYGEWGEHYSEAEEWLYEALQAFTEKVESL